MSNPRLTWPSALRLASSSEATTRSGVAIANCVADQRAAKPPHGEAGRRRAAERAQRLVHRRPAALQRGHEPEEQRAGRGEAARHHQHGPVEPELLHARDRSAEPIRRSTPIPAKASTIPTAAAPSASSALSASRKRMTRRARGAERGADGELAAPAGDPGDEEVRRVRAGDQPHQRDRGQRETAHRLHVADDVGLEVHHAPRRLLVLVRGLPDREQAPVDQRAARRRRPRGPPGCAAARGR